MKKNIYLFICLFITLASCSDNDDNSTYQTFPITVQLTYPASSNYTAVEGVVVKMNNTSGSGSYEGKTDATGKAVVTVPTGIYTISASDSRIISVKRVNFNGQTTGVIVNNSWNTAQVEEVELHSSESAQVVIKELYTGGCPKDDGSGAFIYDRYTILYNNSDENVNIGKMGLATAMPYNSSGTNYYYKNGELTYANEGWIPAGMAVWYFQQDVILAPGKQIVIALTGAINNTLTYSKSINFDNPEYYCTYDNEVFTHALTYPAPASSIPTSHYLKAVAYGLGSGWAMSAVSPSFYLFTPESTTVKQFAEDSSYDDYYNGNTKKITKKVPVEWITDAVEVFTTAYDNQKRLTPAIDGGSVYLTNAEGYSIYRNVDKEATEAIDGNKAKLIYNYTLGTAGTVDKGTTDPSNIDAEASMKNGARIIYKDTNNTTEDFHQRSKASLRN